MENLDFELKTEKETAETGRFVIEPLPAGYGVTLGNALRRVLLSSLPGGAIAEVRIQGISHPFSTIKGLKEDVVELILNLKKVRFSLQGGGPYEATLEVKGKKTVSAKDIKVSSEVLIANPDLKIATLTDKDAKLSATLVVERGVGYKPVEEREGGRVGVIPIDSIFSPVINVAFWTEGTRVGRKTNFERLILEITTDCTIRPSAALAETAAILRGYFDKISLSSASRKAAKPAAAAAEKAKKQPKKETSPRKKSVSKK
ncbi:MAG: DNA-directed RNA polymerase subunit alpha [candidate division WWE3 bacterium]|nr:DNA-directed RNA polymerase subunit alpha [candidate division WWE3 bacterium]